MAPITNPPAPAGLCELRGLEFRDVDPDPETGAARWEFEGHAAVFDSRSENLGGFYEEIKRGAFRDVLSQDTVMLFNHNQDQPLARGEALELTEEPSGLRVRAQIRADLSYASDLRVLLEEGVVRQMSFAFGSDVEDEWSETEDGMPLRTIKRFSSLFDVSPVTFPAYPATDAGLRAFNRLSRGEVVSDEERQAILSLLDSKDPEPEVRGEEAPARELPAEVASSDEQGPDEPAENGAGLPASAAARRIHLLALQART